MFIKKRKIAALNATDESSPKEVKKNTDAPSRMPSSPNEICGIAVFINMIKLPAQR